MEISFRIDSNLRLKAFVIFHFKPRNSLLETLKHKVLCACQLGLIVKTVYEFDINSQRQLSLYMEPFPIDVKISKNP